MSHRDRVICTTCGRDNPSHLIFCQECGQKLATRLATPTPPQGVAAVGISPDGAARSLSSVSQRPPAPNIQFSRRDELPASADDRSVCPLCGSRNQRGLRFCVTCGHLLAQRVSGGGPGLEATAVSAPPVRPPSPPPAAVIAPNRVVQLDDPSPATLETRICPRCHGLLEGAGQFCRICGASIADAAPIDLRPASPARPDTMRPQGAAPVASTVAVFAPRTGRVRLVLIARDGGEGPSYPVGDTTDIGRTEGHIVIGDDPYISPRHARVSLRDGTYFLRDLGTTNGVYLRIPFSVDVDRGLALDAEQELGDQELFLIGQQVLRFEVVKHAEEGFGVASDNGTLLFGTPGAPRYARLSQRTVEGVTRDVFHVHKTETVIGRESGDIVFADDPFLSRRHAVLRVRPGASFARDARRFTLADLGSSNGTFLQVRTEVPLRPGSHFRIGQQLLRLDVDVNRTGA
ncbi:MAG: FHA domain-containing protein [Polyangiaceae bacterium]